MLSFIILFIYIRDIIEFPKFNVVSISSFIMKRVSNSRGTLNNAFPSQTHIDHCDINGSDIPSVPE